VATRASRDSLHLMESRETLGEAGKADLAPFVAALSQDVAVEAGLRHALLMSETLQARFSGMEPAQVSEMSNEMEAGLSKLRVPTNLPYVAPASLVDHRPDIASARSALHAAYAAMGVAEAAQLPQISLDGSSGGAASQVSQLFSPANASWTLAMGLSQPLTNMAALGHQTKAASYDLEAAKANYRSVVLQALTNVADCLDALHSDHIALESALQADDSAFQNLSYAHVSQANGSIGEVELLAAVHTHAQTAAALEAARLQQFLDMAALYVAFGADGTS